MNLFANDEIKQVLQTTAQFYTSYIMEIRNDNNLLFFIFAQKIFIKNRSRDDTLGDAFW